MTKKIRRIRSALEDEIEETVYSEDERISLVENDELTPIEEAFMMGWEKASSEE